MKMFLPVALVGLAISLTVPAFAQQKDTVDPQIIEQLVAVGKKYAEAVNNNDAAAVAALYTEDAVDVADTGPIYGREAIQKHWADAFQKMHFSNLFNKRDKYFPHAIGKDGNVLWGNGEWGTTVQGKDWGPIQVTGYWSLSTQWARYLAKAIIFWEMSPETWEQPKAAAAGRRLGILGSPNGSACNLRS